MAVSPHQPEDKNAMEVDKHTQFIARPCVAKEFIPLLKPEGRATAKVRLHKRNSSSWGDKEKSPIRYEKNQEDF